MVLIGGIVLIILIDAISGKSKKLVATVALLILAGATAITVYELQSHVSNNTASILIFNKSAAYDGFSLFFKVLFLISGVIIGVVSLPVIFKWATGFAEFWMLLIASIFGMLLMSSANDLVMMYLSLEFVSVTSYILSGLLRKDKKSAEASLKYIIYGSAASGVMLFGMSWLYGLTGSLNVVEIGQALQSQAGTDESIKITTSLITSVLIMAGFGYKIAAVPFHMWCPDVYEGAPTPVTAFFSVGPKIAGFAMLVRFLKGIFPAGPGDEAFEWKIIIAIVCFATMAVGNLTALHQNNLKRLFAYSSIAHAGYMLLPFLVFEQHNISSLMFYAFVYLIMNIGAFLVIIALEEKYRIQTVEECKGLGWVDPKLCGTMAVFLFSLTGLPPLAGFMGKFLLLSYIVIPTKPLGIVMAVFAVLFTVVSLYYYARIVAKMFLDKPAERSAESIPFSIESCIWILAIATIALGIFWNPFYTFIDSASKSIAIN